MEMALSIINVLGIIATIVVSGITLVNTRNLQKMQQSVNIMANKRSNRIDSMRTFSANIITSSKIILHGIGDEKTKKTL